MDYNEFTGFVCTKGENEITKVDIPIVPHNALLKEIQNFVDNSLITIETGTVPELKVPGRRGLEALRLALKIREEILAHNKEHKITQWCS